MSEVVLMIMVLLFLLVCCGVVLEKVGLCWFLCCLCLVEGLFVLFVVSGSIFVSVVCEVWFSISSVVVFWVLMVVWLWLGRLGLSLVGLWLWCELIISSGCLMWLVCFG